MYHKMGHDVARLYESSIHSEIGIDNGNNINLEYKAVIEHEQNDYDDNQQANRVTIDKINIRTALQYLANDRSTGRARHE